MVKNEKGKSAVWKHFGSRKCMSDGKIIDGVAVCYTCKAVLKTGGGTSNLVTHLDRHHPHLGAKAAKNKSALKSASPRKTQQILTSGSFKV